LSQPILWRRLDLPGHESARLTGTTLHGAAVFQHSGATRLDYEIVCDDAWRTRSARVSGWIGDGIVHVRILHDNGIWTMNDEPVAAVAGCIDVDLNFSPSTNLLPIRRLNLNIGDEAEVRAAWLRFPSLALEPLVQTYTRLDTNRYRYSSAGGSFVAEIEVDALGFPIEYAGLWRAEKS
jgi:uncharacterized protein